MTNETDRELLELAAKAAGKKLSDPIDSYIPNGSLWVVGRNGMDEVWDPLNEDGDALRLAVQLHIGIRSHGPDHWQQPNTSVALYEIGEFGGGRIQVEHGDDPAHATRRAIVRAAAEIGKSMP